MTSSQFEPRPTAPDTKEVKYLDVAIVGGGISGTYTGWRLRDEGLKIQIFENTNRIGGRIYTVSFPCAPDVPIELGAMRYIPGVHAKLECVLQSLGLKTRVFKMDQYSKMFYLRGKRLSRRQLDSDLLPYNLGPGESRDVDALNRYLSQRALNVSRPDQISDIEEAVTPDGVPVYKQGILNLLDSIVSNEAKQYLKDVWGFHTEFSPCTNAVHYFAATNQNNEALGKRTVVDGLGQIPEKMADEFQAASDSHDVKLNRRVDSIKRIKSGDGYVLKIYQTETVEGYTRDKEGTAEDVFVKQVILAVPPKALKNIDWDPLNRNPNGKEMLDSVNDCSAMKIFLAYPNAWWDNTTIRNKAFVTDLPIRQVGEFGRFTDSLGEEIAVMLVAYADGTTSSEFWRNLRNMGGDTISSPGIPASLAVNKKIVQCVHRHLGTLYNVRPDTIPAPLDGVIQFWEVDRNGNAWQFFKPGYQPTAVAKFMRRPSADDQVFVVTSAFEEGLSTWTEGCLNAADSVLGEFFNVA